MELREAVAGDLGKLNDLYNHYVLTSACTFDIEPVSMDARREWFEGFGGRYRLVVASRDGNLLGYAHSKPYRPKAAYETSVETTVYVAAGAEGRGVGTSLYRALFGLLEDQDVHRAYAGVTMPNPASVALHERFGFERVAYFTEQGRKFGRYWDVAWFEKPLLRHRATQRQRARPTPRSLSGYAIMPACCRNLPPHCSEGHGAVQGSPRRSWHDSLG